MSIWSRVANVFRRHVDDDIDAELQSHFDEADADGRDPAEASRAFGSRLRVREAVRDAIVARWLESLVADAVFGWRQLVKHKTASAAAVLSLALGIGASMAAFRLIDALFLRPLPIANPERLYVLTYENLFDGKVSTSDQFDYPGFRLLRAAVKDEAELIAVAFPDRIDLTFGPDQDLEHASRQHVSGWMFSEFGLQPALGRLFNERDDLTPGAHPYTVISYDYWSRRFGKDPTVIGRRFRTGLDALEIIGVAPERFTGTDPGTFTDMFMPNMMNVPAVSESVGAYRTVYRIWANPKPGSSLDQIRERLSGALHAYRREQVKTWLGRLTRERDWFADAPVTLEPAAAGRSNTQRIYRPSLTIFAMLVGLVLLIACANVASLMTAQTAARAREMALRVSIGAGRARLLQLVLTESALVAVAASALGLAGSWWAAPFMVNHLNPLYLPVRLTLRVDWRVTTFAVALTFAITMLFGLAPALRVSSITPASALKGGDDPHGRRRVMNALVAAQVAFSLLVLFVAGLFIATFERMANQPTGFSSTRLLTLQSASGTELSTERWYDAVQRVRSLPGVESAALAHTALMAGSARNSSVWANGQAPDGTFLNRTWLLRVSPGWFDTMGVQLVEGRDLRWDDSVPNVAVVNETFSRRYFGGQSPVGHSFETLSDFGGLQTSQGTARVAVRIVGLVRDVRYEDMRLPFPATAYIPFRTLSGGAERTYTSATFIVRTKTADPTALASMLRQEIPRAQPEIRVTNVVTQGELVRSQMIRERLLATLSLFFAAVALILAAVGLYGVLNYAVLERRRELGIRIALGAQGGDIAWHVTAEVLFMLALGTAVGLALGVAAGRYVATLLYEVKATDPSILALPVITMSAVALLAALPSVLRAIRFDPAVLLRAE